MVVRSLLVQHAAEVNSKKQPGGTVELADTLSGANASLCYCQDADIPEVQDVLFCLGLYVVEEKYKIGRTLSNRKTYIQNVRTVAAVVRSEVRSMYQLYGEAKAQRIIAKAIIDLCPDEAKCYLNNAFVQAQIASGSGWWSLVLCSAGETRLQACPCVNCHKTRSLVDNGDAAASD